MKNKRYKKLIITELFIFIIVILLTYIINIIINNYYNKELNDNNGIIINGILEKYPNLEDDLVEILMQKKNTDSTFLDKYDMKTTIKTNSLIYIIPITCFILLIVNFIIYNYIFNKRLKSIDNYLFNVLKGDYSLDIRDYSEDNLSLLKNDIYKITVLLKENNNNIKKEKQNLENILSDISHQIKTPLTGMMIANEILLTNKINNETKVELINNNIKELERINFLVSNILKSCRLESGSETLDIKKYSLLSIINDTLSHLIVTLELKKVNVIKEVYDNIYIYVDYNWTIEALLNIFKNAITYAIDNNIQIIACENPIYTELKVINKGNICKEDIPHLFERFYRGKNAKSDSIGIGLNMSMNIIKKEKGEITVESKDNITTFIIKFYKAL